MPKIERKTQKIFGGNADSDQLAVFGSMITGTPVYNDDIETLQSEAYTEGWQVAVAANEAPFMEEMNGVQYGFSKQLAYLFQQGIPEWDSGTTYYLNSFCQVGGVIYKSMQDENINHSPADDTEGTYWSPLETGGGGSSGLEVCDIGMALYVDETKGLRRYLNGQIVDINTNTQAFLNRLKQITTLYPSLLCTEEEWQTAKTMSAFGQVGKFVLNYAQATEEWSIISQGILSPALRVIKKAKNDVAVGDVAYDWNDETKTADTTPYTITGLWASGDGFEVSFDSDGSSNGWSYEEAYENTATSDTEIESVRLPAVVNIQGLFDLQNLGVTVAAGLPNITGKTNFKAGAGGWQNFDGAITTTAVNTAYGSRNNPQNNDITLDFNASRSSSIYGNSDTVQPEAIQYPYFIQIATGAETENNIINEIELNNPYSLFDSKYSPYKLNNISWLKSEGQWNAKAVYPSAYDELLKEYNSPDRLATFNKDAFEVVGSPSITSDGVASGFSSDNYIDTNYSINTINSQNLNIDISFTTSSDVTTNQYILHSKTYAQLGVFIRNGLLGFAIGKNNAWLGDIIVNTVTNNTRYNLNLNFTPSVVTYTLKTNDTIITNFVADKTMLGDTQNMNLRLGVTRNGAAPFLGLINLPSFSITVDGKKVFSGAKSKVKLSTEDYTDYDFVINTTDETFRLPLKNGMEGMFSGQAVVGNGMTLGLTNNSTNGGLSAYNIDNGNLQGLRTYSGIYGSPAGTAAAGSLTSTGNLSLGVTTDPSKSGLVVAGAGEVPDGWSLYYYVGETVQNANLIDAGRIGEQLADKVDMLQASGAGMPSNKYIDLTLGASGTTYTAPANGWICAEKAANAANQYISGGEPKPGQNGSVYSERISYIASYSSSTVLAPIIFFPVRKGSTYFINYDASGDTLMFRFIYANGAQGGS